MFTVSEIEAATIRTTWEQEGELSAAIELRRLFPGVGDMAKARQMARTIAGWRQMTAVEPKRKTSEMGHPPRVAAKATS